MECTAAQMDTAPGISFEDYNYFYLFVSDLLTGNVSELVVTFPPQGRMLSAWRGTRLCWQTAGLDQQQVWAFLFVSVIGLDHFRTGDEIWEFSDNPDTILISSCTTVPMQNFRILEQLLKIPPLSARKCHSARGRGGPRFVCGLES